MNRQQRRLAYKKQKKQEKELILSWIRNVNMSEFSKRVWIPDKVIELYVRECLRRENNSTETISNNPESEYESFLYIISKLKPKTSALNLYDVSWEPLSEEDLNLWDCDKSFKAIEAFLSDLKKKNEDKEDD